MRYIWPFFGAILGFSVASLIAVLIVIHQGNFTRANLALVIGTSAGFVAGAFIGAIRPR